MQVDTPPQKCFYLQTPLEVSVKSIATIDTYHLLHWVIATSHELIPHF